MTVSIPAGKSGEFTGILQRLNAVVIAFSRRIAALGVLVILATGLVTSFDVAVMRWIFNAPLSTTNEVMTLLFSVGIASVLASGLAQGGTLEFDIFADKLGPRVTAWLRAGGAAIYLVILLILCISVFGYGFQTMQRGNLTTLLQWPVWPVQLGIAVMLTLCLPVQLITYLRRVEDAAAVGGGGFAGPALGVLAGTALVAGAVWWGIGAWQAVLADNAILWATCVLALLWLLILLFVPLAAALMVCAVIGIGGLMGPQLGLSVTGSETVALISSSDMAVIPFFLMMSGFAVASGMASDLFRLAHATFAPLRGGLALATIGGCASFGALTGSSVGTIAAIGSAAFPEMRQRGYATGLAAGSIAAGGTLGQLIPPSTAVVVYALMTDGSIGQLYMAILVPALMTVAFYMATVMITIWRNPAAVPAGGRFDGRELVSALFASLPAIAMFAIMLGGIFAGIFTATEAASVGTVIAFAVTVMRGRLKGNALWRVIGETTRATSMLYFVLIGAMLVTFFIGSSNLPQQLSSWLTHSSLPSLVILALVIVGFIVLGCVMDSFTILLITAPILAPVMIGLGYDGIWWGIMMVILVEIGVITPPFGVNLFIMKSTAPELPLTVIFRGVLPFVVADLVKVALLVAFPALVLWLPHLAAAR